MGDIVEHITPLYIKAHEEWLSSRDDRDFWEIAVPLVARATLEYLRENDKQKLIVAAWAAWHSRHGGKLGPGPAFVEAIDAMISAALNDIERVG
jgi:hypothetical protein